MRGRKPKPTSQQIAAGDPRKKGKRKLQEALESEVQAKRGLPDCPRHLRGRARHCWKFWNEELVAMNLDCRPDAMMLEGACVNYARAVTADLLIEKQGMVMEEPIVDRDTGDQIGVKMKNHPAIAISNQAWRQVRAFCSEFGLSPVARQRIKIEKDDKAGTEDLAELLSRPRAPRPPVTLQ